MWVKLELDSVDLEVVVVVVADNAVGDLDHRKWNLSKSKIDHEVLVSMERILVDFPVVGVVAVSVGFDQWNGAWM